MPARTQNAHNYSAIAEQLRAIAAIEHDPQRAELIRKIADDYANMGVSAATEQAAPVPDDTPDAGH